MTDYKQLCAELAEQLDDALDFTVSGETRRHMKLLTRRARTALAQSEPEKPSDEELDELFVEIDQSGKALSWRAYARAVLARWGRQ